MSFDAQQAPAQPTNVWARTLDTDARGVGSVMYAHFLFGLNQHGHISLLMSRGEKTPWEMYTEKLK